MPGQRERERERQREREKKEEDSTIVSEVKNFTENPSLLKTERSFACP